MLGVTTTWNSRALTKDEAVPRGAQLVQTSRAQRELRAVIRDISRLFFWSEIRDGLINIRRLSIVPIKGMSAVPIALLEPFGDDRKVVDLFSVNFIAFLADVTNPTVQ